MLLAHVIAFVISIAAAGTPSAPSAPVVALRPRATVASTKIRVADVCEVTCDDEELARRISEAEITQAPLPGRHHTVTRGWVKLALRRAGVDVGPIVFRGAAEATVARPPSQTVAALRETHGTGPSAVAPQPGISRGARVVVVVRAGCVTVTAVGEALAPAAPGEALRVRVVGTRAVVRGALSGDGTVHVPCESEVP